MEEDPIYSLELPWFTLEIKGYEDNREVQAWLKECQRRMMMVFLENTRAEMNEH